MLLTTALFSMPALQLPDGNTGFRVLYPQDSAKLPKLQDKRTPQQSRISRAAQSLTAAYNQIQSANPEEKLEKRLIKQINTLDEDISVCVKQANNDCMNKIDKLEEIKNKILAAISEAGFAMNYLHIKFDGVEYDKNKVEGKLNRLVIKINSLFQTENVARHVVRHYVKSEKPSDIYQLFYAMNYEDRESYGSKSLVEVATGLYSREDLLKVIVTQTFDDKIPDKTKAVVESLIEIINKGTQESYREANRVYYDNALKGLEFIKQIIGDDYKKEIDEYISA
eukprot:NODE_24_length_36516_cov_0.652470.p12 type:complete len:281 gc:universal NODE_24_length_36516_cov_0.652470:716-1558(+)